MSKFTETLKKIESLFLGFNEIPPAPAPIPPVVAPLELAATEYPLADGTVLSVDKLEVNGNATIAGAPAEGSFTLADGTIVNVMAGVIMEVKAPEAMQAPAVSQEAFNAFKAETDATINALKEQVKQAVEISKEQFSVVQLMAVEPAGAPLEKPKDWEEMTALEKRRATK